ncbi:hypothetical protein T4A_2553 [Trichinella pseudospiralis]|uniref:Peptidase aspartic putative domain-containing protein n=1 Tax=Trichinella pseudospiralis TaxID=6337 RepID=A0A0V1ESI8_TRIPS|nr:hypothetical protein T4A_2553 [Trichinella pseudospiralis]
MGPEANALQRAWDLKVGTGPESDDNLQNFLEFAQLQADSLFLTGDPGLEEVRDRVRSSAAALVTFVQRVCTFCEGDHDATTSKRFWDADHASRASLSREKGVCYKCLKTVTEQGNVARGATHHQLLHPPVAKESYWSPEPDRSHQGLLVTRSTLSGCLQITRARAYGRTKSQVLGLTGPHERCRFTTLGGHVGPERRWRRVEFRLGAVESSDRLKASTKVKALAIPRVCGKVQPVPDEHTDGSPAETESEKKQRQGAPLVIDILIGIDYYYEFMTGRVRRTTRGAVAVESRLGGIVCGRTDSQRPSHAGVFLSKGEHSDDSTLRKFWEIKSLGDTFRRRHHCGRICSPEEGRPDLPNNYPQAKRRLLALQRRLDVRKEDRAIYASVMRQYFDEGCAGSRSTEADVVSPASCGLPGIRQRTEVPDSVRWSSLIQRNHAE